MKDSVRKLGPESVRVLLTTESRREAERVIRSSAAAFLRGEDAAEPYEKFTRGHMKRGVE